MYDNTIPAERFRNYRGILSKIWQGEDVEVDIETIEKDIHRDYEARRVSTTI